MFNIEIQLIQMEQWMVLYMNWNWNHMKSYDNICHDDIPYINVICRDIIFNSGE